MRRTFTGGLAAAALWFAPSWLPLAAATLPAAAPSPPAAAPDALVGELDTVIQQSVTAARAEQEHQRAITSLARELVTADRELVAKQRALADSRARQAAVLAALERLAANPPEAILLASRRPIDRIRGGMLMSAAVPALSAEAQALAAELQRLATLRGQTAARHTALAHNRQHLVSDREKVAQLVVKREALRHQILREEADGNPRALKLGAIAADLSDLIKRADAEAAERDHPTQPRGAKAKAPPAIDPTRPKGLREFDPHAALVAPVAGSITRHFGEADGSAVPSQGLALRGPGGADVVAPYDGRVDYVGPFRAYPLILIIGHGGGYHSILTGMARVDAKVGEWVVAGEPIGAMPEPGKTDEGATIYFELRRDGRPIDPPLSLADRGEQIAGHRVTE